MTKRLIIIWLTLIFTLFLVLAIYAFHKSKPLIFLGSEILIPLLYAVTVWMVIRALKPIAFIGRGINLLKEREYNIRLVKTGYRDVDNIIEVYNSMINRLREERLSIREKNQFLDLLIESSPLGIVIVDLDDRITDINKAAYECLNVQPADCKGRKLSDLNSILASELGKIDYNEKQLTILANRQKYLCRKLYFMDHGFRHPFFILEEFTEEIKKAEKEAYSKLIRMMAHEVNNTIGSVNSIMSTVQANPDLFVESEREDMVRVLSVAIQRNYQLNRFMQNLSNVVKLPLPEKEQMDLKESLMIVIESLDSLLKERNIVLTTDLNEYSPVIFADRSQMEQVFSNIIKNSIEAINDEGHIIVSLKTNPPCIRIEDDGTGLSKEAIGRIFTPFYSTKKGGQGLGLTFVNEILTNHGYSFSLLNRDSGGAEFIIKF
jgi:nitrogen fixation/metabolism regulation signal transduction histidine kinase